MERTFEAWLEDSTPLSPHRDLRGLSVHDSDDLLAGQVYGVLSETEVGVIRFLDVQLEDEGRHVLVPIGHARLEEVHGSPRLRLRAARLEDLRKVPSYEGDMDWNSVDNARELAGLYGRFFRGDHYYAHPAYNHHGWYAGPHPILPEDGAGHASEPTLVSSAQLGDLGARPLLDADGAPAGKVVDTLVDRETNAPRYAVIQLADAARRLLPIGYLDHEQSDLRIPGLAVADLRALPDFTGAVPDRAEEEEILDRIERALDVRNPFLRVDFSDRQVLPE